jgi:hypothetical protein
MQLAPAPAFVSRPAESPPVATRLAEFCFASDAALERALALAADQSWIAACTVDRARRTLRVTLCPGVPQAAPYRHAGGASLH